MKYKQPSAGVELWLPGMFPTTITVTSRAPYFFRRFASDNFVESCWIPIVFLKIFFRVTMTGSNLARGSWRFPSHKDPWERHESLWENSWAVRATERKLGEGGYVNTWFKIAWFKFYLRVIPVISYNFCSCEGDIVELKNTLSLIHHKSIYLSIYLSIYRGDYIQRQMQSY